MSEYFELKIVKKQTKVIVPKNTTEKAIIKKV